MRVAPEVQHPHVKSVRLLQQLTKWRRLNDGPFRVLHAIAFVLFLFFWITHIPEVNVETSSVQNTTDVPIPVVFDDEVDSNLDSTVESSPEGVAEDGEPSVEPVEIWEPKTPSDYIRVAWVIIGIVHALVNLFCIWVVRVKVFCQFQQVGALSDADHVLCVPHANHGDAAITPLVFRTIEVAGSSKGSLEKVWFDQASFSQACHAVKINSFRGLQSPR
jgi:hypothetical protein